MTAESKRLHDKLMPPGHYESVLERETASWFACTTYADAELPTELKVRSNADMEKITSDDISKVLGGILKQTDTELLACTQEQLERYWFFRWNPDQSKAWNFYEFHELLGLYRRKCRQWEEHYNGHVCVVERVRDKYLLPKIEAFIEQLGV